MLNKHKYWKSLLGTSADILIAKQVDYAGTGAAATTAGGSIEDFRTNAVEGEIGIFDADLNTGITGVTSGSPAAVQPVSTSKWLYAVVKRDGNLEFTNRFRLSDYKASRAAYAVGVAQISTAAFSGSLVAGSDYGVRVIETTPGNQPFPTWYYNVTPKSGETLAQLLQRIVDRINDASDIVNKNTDPIVTATLGSTTITLTAKDKGVTFRLAFSPAAISDLAAVAAYGTAAFWGNGTYEQVAELEKYADVLKGVTTNYPGAGTNPEDFGKPTVFAASGVQYSIYYLVGTKTEFSPTPVDQHQFKHQIILAIPSNGSANAEAEIKGILGL
jgi:hypothetical protein